MTKIEKKIPIPRGHRKRLKFYADLISMKKGDSFIFAEADYRNARVRLMYIRAKYPNRKYRTRSISATRRRIWRLK